MWIISLKREKQKQHFKHSRLNQHLRSLYKCSLFHYYSISSGSKLTYFDFYNLDNNIRIKRKDNDIERIHPKLLWNSGMYPTEHRKRGSFHFLTDLIILLFCCKLSSSPSHCYKKLLTLSSFVLYRFWRHTERRR